MTDQPSPNQNYRDEIDLRKLFQAIGNFFIGIGHAIINLIIVFRRLTIKYRVLIISAIIIGAIAGFGINKFEKPYYRTSLLLKSAYLNAKLVENSLNKLNLLAEEKDRAGLADILNIDIALADNIDKFTYEPFIAEADVVEIELLKQKLEELKIDNKDIDKVIKQIEIENKNTYFITVQIYDVDIITNLEEALVGYFKNNPYVINRITVNRKLQEQLITKLYADLVQLDSLKYAYNYSLKQQANRKSESSNSLILAESGFLDPTMAYSQSVLLFEKLQEAQAKFQLSSDFELVDGFTTFSKPDSPGMYKSIINLSAIFLGIAYLLIFLIELNKYLNKVEESGFE